MKIGLTPWPRQFIMLTSPTPRAANRTKGAKRSENNVGKRRWFYGDIYGCSGRIS
jgi:hypothetical protein